MIGTTLRKDTPACTASLQRLLPVEIGAMGYSVPDWKDSLEERPDMEDEKGLS